MQVFRLAIPGLRMRETGGTLVPGSWRVGFDRSLRAEWASNHRGQRALAAHFGMHFERFLRTMQQVNVCCADVASQRRLGLVWVSAVRVGL